MQPKRFLYEKMKELVNTVSGPMTQSTFQATGKLTPQEFVEAGDALVARFPAWEWVAGDAAVLPFLPADKKFLALRNCPCHERATAMEDDQGGERDHGDGWLETHTAHVASASAGAAPAGAAPAAAAADDGEVGWDDEPDPSKAAPAAADPKFRLYDVTVIYDQYYATPRVYLFGYSESNHSKPLAKEEMMEDVYAANREKTVTVDPHPFLKAPCISIHPCRHAETMQRILARLAQRCEEEQEDMEAKDRVPFVFPTYMALFVFLKFISSVVPTINYDIQTDFEM